MNWPIKFFENFIVKGKSGNREIKQSVRRNSAPVNQAGRDINIQSTFRQPARIPYVFVSGTGFGGSGGDEARFVANVTNASDEHVFATKFVVFGQEYDLEDFSIPPKETKRTMDIFMPFPQGEIESELLLFYSDSSNKNFCTRHALNIEKRADGKFNINGIRAKRPATRVR